MVFMVKAFRIYSNPNGSFIFIRCYHSGMYNETYGKDTSGVALEIKPHIFCGLLVFDEFCMWFYTTKLKAQVNHSSPKCVGFQNSGTFGPLAWVVFSFFFLKPNVIRRMVERTAHIMNFLGSFEGLRSNASLTKLQFLRGGNHRLKICHNNSIIRLTITRSTYLVSSIIRLI